MNIAGHGVDIVAINRIRLLLEKSAEDFLDSTFTSAEREGAESTITAPNYYAGRFAAKEAVSKALGTGVAGDISWTDIQILRGVNGQPEITLFGAALTHAIAAGINRWLISISHNDDHAIASVIAISD